MNSGKQIILPTTIHTDPEIAHIGNYAQDLEINNFQYETWTKFYERLDRSICEEKSGMIKILTAKGTDIILGATVVGGPAVETIMIFSSAI